MSERKKRSKMIEETTSKLIAAARAAFAKDGYAATSMDELCATAGLTRGALYHHFGGKEGLLEAVVRQIDAEIDGALKLQDERYADRWEAFRACCQAYLRLALNPEIQRISFKDAPAVLGQRFRDIDAATAIGPTAAALASLMASGRVRKADPTAMAQLLNGAMMDASLWIANASDPAAALDAAAQGLDVLLDGLER